MAHIILGASGRVGSAAVDKLLERGAAVKGVVRKEEKAEGLRSRGADAAIADAHNLAALKVAMRDGETLFALTPETGREENVLGDTNDILIKLSRGIGCQRDSKGRRAIVDGRTTPRGNG
jgi:uncharacterized protein YbjT (DUF2867 family)